MFIVFIYFIFLYFYSTVQHSVHSCWEECAINKALLTYLLTKEVFRKHVTILLNYSDAQTDMAEGRIRRYKKNPCDNCWNYVIQRTVG